MNKKIPPRHTTTRRSLIGGTLAFGLLPVLGGEGTKDGNATAQTGGVWGGWKPGEFQVHFIYTGVGESMFLIFPDATTMLLDCGDHSALTRMELALPVLPNPGRLAGDWVARYVTRVNPNGADVDYMMTSHWHTDHVGSPYWQSARPLKKGEKPTGLVRSGFGLAAETLHFKKAIDRGWPDYDDPVSRYNNEERLSLELMKQVYSFLAKRDGLTVEKFRLGATDQIVPLRNPSSVNGFSVRNIAANGRLALPDGTIKDVMKHPDGSPMKCYNENLLSLGNVFCYGKFRFYAAGDFSGPGDLASSNRFYPERLIGKAAAKLMWPRSIIMAAMRCLWTWCVTFRHGSMWPACGISFMLQTTRWRACRTRRSIPESVRSFPASCQLNGGLLKAIGHGCATCRRPFTRGVTLSFRFRREVRPIGSPA